MDTNEVARAAAPPAAARRSKPQIKSAHTQKFGQFPLPHCDACTRDCPYFVLRSIVEAPDRLAKRLIDIGDEIVDVFEAN